MDHHIITIDASTPQLSKLRRGLPVRIKKGKGFNLLVHPETYRLVSRAFARDKGAEVALSPEEIEANRGFSPEQHAALRETQPEMAGKGIFGKKFDRALKKAGIKKLAYKVGDVLKPHAKNLITAGMTAGATALGAMQPELIPIIAPATAGLTKIAHDYLDKPHTGLKSTAVRSIAEEAAKGVANQKLNQALGTNYDYMSRAGLDNAISDQISSQLSADAIASRFGGFPAPQTVVGHGLHRRMHRPTGGAVGLHGSLLHHKPPALKSQPMSANFQMQHFLPPSYQGFNAGAGLYAGKGLY
jgi:hypothetical protein